MDEENDSIVAKKSFNFAIRIVNLFKYLQQDKKEYILSKQLLRCGTSVGANIEEAIGAYSRKDFAAKMSISYKEIREVKYWLKLMYATEYITQKEFESLLSDADELAKMLFKIINTTRSTRVN